MKILIIVGFVIPKAAEFINEPKIPFGGWVTGFIEGLSKIEGVEIGVAMKSSQKVLLSTEIEGVKYYYLPTNKLNKLDVNIIDCAEVLSNFKPDILHAEGAEVYIPNRFIKIFEGKKVISVKGVFNDVQKYEYADIYPGSLLRSFNLTKIIFGLTQIYKKKYRYVKRKKIEIDSYKASNYAIGRTLYDKAHVLNFNQNIIYFHNNETLRTPFYTEKWYLEKAIPYSIIIGSGYLARKGAHVAIKALAILKRNFPSVRLFIIGGESKSLIDKLTYKGYIKKLINEYGLNDNVTFLGVLNEISMVEAILNKHVYVLPSFIENSSNTLGEAMLLGVPSVVSYCGGVSSLAVDEEEALFYRASDHIMLAHQISRIFNNEIDVVNLSNNARNKALCLYDKKNNSERIVEIYNQIISHEI
jgi:glycosyltransferase involved in cell wall biosynthesis